MRGAIDKEHSPVMSGTPLIAFSLQCMFVSFYPYNRLRYRYSPTWQNPSTDPTPTPTRTIIWKSWQETYPCSPEILRCRLSYYSALCLSVTMKLRASRLHQFELPTASKCWTKQPARRTEQCRPSSSQRLYQVFAYFMRSQRNTTQSDICMNMALAADACRAVIGILALPRHLGVNKPEKRNRKTVIVSPLMFLPGPPITAMITKHIFPAK